MPAMIPMRPRTGQFNLKPEEMDCLSYYVLSGCPREVAFIKFVRPDFLGTKSPTALRGAVSQFFAMHDVKEYMDSYKSTIEHLIDQKYKRDNAPTGSAEERKAKARSKLVDFAVSLANDIENAGDPEMVLKLADKVGLLDGDEQVEEQPRRYLPVTCSECAYKKFVEDNCDEVEDGTNIEGEEYE